MVQFNFSERTIKAKVVYYGPPQSGKTTNLEQIHKITDPEGANRLISLNTAQDRTLFFDLLPFSLGTVSGYDFKIQLYTVPGQVQYNATRRVVLAGADAVVFVADSQKSMARENQTAFENMKVNLLANRLVPEKVPLVLQYNKQDLDRLLSRAELDRALNFWGRKAFPAIASRGEGVMETFVAVVQDMLSAVAAKYNLKEKGLDPEAVPQIVAEAFQTLLRKTPEQGLTPPPVAPPVATPASLAAAPAAPAAPPRPAAPPLPVAVARASAVASMSAGAPPVAASMPARVVISQPDGAEPAYPGQAGPEVSPVSEELLHRAIRSNVDLAETLGRVVREMSLGLRAIYSRLEGLGGDDTARQAATAVRREVQRLYQILQELGRAPRAATAPGVAAALPESAHAALAGSAAPTHGATAGRAAAPHHAPAAAPAAPSTGPAASLDALLTEVASVVRPALGARAITLENHIPRGTALPRCSPAALRRAIASFLQALAALVAPSSAIAVRAERKPVLLRGRDGAEQKRDFVMIALTHAGGLDDGDQQRVLKGADAGALGEGFRAVREMGGFLRFAPLPAGALETRLFLPA
jgi:signal recognition particle receptor subunit beta